MIIKLDVAISAGSPFKYYFLLETSQSVSIDSTNVLSYVYKFNKHNR